MSEADYVRPRTEAPNRVKSDQQLKDEAKMRSDVEQWKKDNVVTEGSPLYTRSQYKGSKARWVFGASQRCRVGAAS